VDTIQRRRRSPRGGALDPMMMRPSTPVRSSRASGSVKRCYDRGAWCEVTVNPNRSTITCPLYTLTRRTLAPTGLVGCMGHRLDHSFRVWPKPCAHAGRTDFWYFLFSVLLVCNLNLNLNFVLIPANSYNPVEYFCNIVMINFIFRL
jgi:hypothetical protein